MKARNIRRNPRVSFVVDDFLGPMREARIRGVSVSGKAELISSGKLHETGRDLFYEWYPWWKEQYPIQEGGLGNILVITPTKVRSWGLT